MSFLFKKFLNTIVFYRKYQRLGGVMVLRPLDLPLLSVMESTIADAIVQRVVRQACVSGMAKLFWVITWYKI